ncbi:hypothetical protein BH11ACT8_BH11ACT8_09780 [soil metagenome]
MSSDAVLPSPVSHGLPGRATRDLARRHEELARRHRAELHLTGVLADNGGIAGVVEATAGLLAMPLWLIDLRHRVVARSRHEHGSDFRPPDVDLLLAQCGPVDLESHEALLVNAQPARGIARRHLVVPVARDGCLFAWLVVAEVSTRITREEAWLSARAAFHLAGEYAVQRRVAGSAWNARASLARQLVRGSHRDDDLATAADYLGVRVDADRVLVYVADSVGEPPREPEELAEQVERELGVEVLGTRGREGTILLVEAIDGATPATVVHRVKQVMRRVLADLGDPTATVGVSAVTRPGALQRSYRETREVVLCVDRFSHGGDRVIAVDDLGPARLFVANGDVSAVRRYVGEVLGPLLDDAPGRPDLLRTLQCFFDTGRSVRESAGRLAIHENTVRLRLAKVHDLTGLDVAAGANDQLSVQTALLVLRLEGHPAIPPFDESPAAHLSPAAVG